MQIYQQNQERWKKQGLEQGKLEVAKNMLNEGVPKDSVKKCTGISDADLEKLLD